MANLGDEKLYSSVLELASKVKQDKTAMREFKNICRAYCLFVDLAKSFEEKYSKFSISPKILPKRKPTQHNPQENPSATKAVKQIVKARSDAVAPPMTMAIVPKLEPVKKPYTNAELADNVLACMGEFYKSSSANGFMASLRHDIYFLREEAKRITECYNFSDCIFSMYRKYRGLHEPELNSPLEKLCYIRDKPRIAYNDGVIQPALKYIISCYVKILSYKVERTIIASDGESKVRGIVIQLPKIGFINLSVALKGILSNDEIDRLYYCEVGYAMVSQLKVKAQPKEVDQSLISDVDIEDVESLSFCKHFVSKMTPKMINDAVERFNKRKYKYNRECKIFGFINSKYNQMNK